MLLFVSVCNVFEHGGLWWLMLVTVIFALFFCFTMVEVAIIFFYYYFFPPDVPSYYMQMHSRGEKYYTALLSITLIDEHFVANTLHRGI